MKSKYVIIHNFVLPLEFLFVCFFFVNWLGKKDIFEGKVHKHFASNYAAEVFYITGHVMYYVLYIGNEIMVHSIEDFFQKVRLLNRL